MESDFGIPIPGHELPREQWARTAIKKMPPPGPLDWDGLFGRRAPVVLDLGCGNGRFLLSSALARPELNHFGCDILPLVIRYATKRANRRGLWNVRLAVIGASELLEKYVAPGSVAEVHLYHPQPYKDAAKAERRLITPQFLALVHRALESRHAPTKPSLPRGADDVRSTPDEDIHEARQQPVTAAPDAVGVPATDSAGLFVIQTDNRAYWSYIRHVAPLLFEFEELRGVWPDAPKGRTRREIYARRHKMKIYRGQGRPRDLSPKQVAEIVRSAPPPKFQA
jgi:tRNA (guanine-N7-)-methyltransferase